MRAENYSGWVFGLVRGRGALRGGSEVDHNDRAEVVIVSTFSYSLLLVLEILIITFIDSSSSLGVR